MQRPSDLGGGCASPNATSLILTRMGRMRDVDFITTLKTADEQELIPTESALPAKSESLNQRLGLRIEQTGLGHIDRQLYAFAHGMSRV
jgi:hypothetical protein